MTLAARLEAPLTLNDVNPVAAPSKSRAPVTVKPLLPPAKVDPKLTVEADKVRAPPERVTALEYVCVEVVVMFPFNVAKPFPRKLKEVSVDSFETDC